MQPPTTPLQPGMTGPQVQELQNFLVSQGYLTPAQVATGPGIYGPQTTTAVLKYQQALGIDYSSGPGYWGPKTIAAAGGSQQPAQQPPQQQPQQQPAPQQTYTTPSGAVVTPDGQLVSPPPAQQQTPPQQQPQQQVPPPPLTSNVTASSSGTQPIFMGNNALIKIQGYPGTYLVDSQAKTIRPFANDQAVQNAFPGVTPDHIVTVPPSYVSAGGMFDPNAGYQMLDNSYAIQTNGSFQTLNASNAQLQARYGQPIDTNAEQDAYMLVDAMMHAGTDNPQGGIPAAYVETLKNDKNALAMMISAVAYGGYTPGDVYSEMKRMYLVSTGDTSLANSSPISATQNRQTYQVTDQGKQALSNPKLTPPASIGTLDPQVMKLPLFQIPAEAFKTLIPIMNPDTPEFKAAVAQIQDAYHDVLLQQLSASTDQQKAVADASWARFKETAETQLGIQLSNNALDAWTQIQNAGQQFAQQGIEGSGLEAESIDDYLKRVRSQGDQARTATKSREDEQESIYYQKYATPQQIKDLVASDPAKAASYGLVPSADIKSTMSFAAMKAKYPNLSDQEINDYINSVLDENGNYRSSLYQTYMNGKISTNQAADTYKQGMVMQNSLNDEAKAYREFTTPDSPFLRDVPNPTGTPNTGLGSASSIMNSGQSSIPNNQPPQNTSTPATPALPAQQPYNPPAQQTYTPPAQQPTYSQPTSQPAPYTPPAPQQTTSQAPINWGAYQPTTTLAPVAKPPVNPFTPAPSGSFSINPILTPANSPSPTPSISSPSLVSKAVSAVSSGASSLWGGIKSLF